MPHQEDYQGRAIEVDDRNTVSINGKYIDVEQDPDDGTWRSNYLPYSNYDSAIELARAIARDAPEFSNETG